MGHESAPSGCPVTQHPDGVWHVTGHPEAVRVATTPEVFASGGRRHRHIPGGLDGQEHRRFRAIVDAHLSAERIRGLMPMIRQISEDLVAGIISRSGPVEIVGDLGQHVAVQVQCRWLGWPPELHETLLEWIDASVAASRSGEPARNTEVAEAFDRIVSDIVDARRALEATGARLHEDPTTALLHERVEDPGAPGGVRDLTHAELVSILRNWTAGDLGSIAASIGVVVHHVARDQPEQRRLRALAHEEDAHSEALDAAVDEMLRIDDPFPANRRTTTREADLAGQQLPAGAPVSIDWAQANRDERAFGDPDGYRPATHRPENLVYGVGPHVCPGRLLATMQIRGALAALLRATTGIALDPQRPALRQPGSARGFDAVWTLLT